MQQFVVPQFIEVEDKIFGPITIRQFLILLAGSVSGFLGFRLLDFALFLLFIVIDGGLTLLFAFVRINGQPFHYFLLNIFETLRKPGLRIWNKRLRREELNYLRLFGSDTAPPPVVVKKKVRRDRIKDLSLVVNTGGYYRPHDHV